MKSNQFWALVWIIIAVGVPHNGNTVDIVWRLFDLSVAAYFYWQAIKAGEFR